MHEEEEGGDQLSGNRTADELGEHDFGASVRKRPMAEEEIGEPVQVFHLNVGSSEHVRLLVVLDQTHSDVCFFNCHFVGLLRYDRDHVAELALDRELANGSHHELSLHGSDRRADAQTAEVTQGQEQLFEGLVSQDERELSALEQ